MTIYRYHCAVGNIRFIPDGSSASCVQSTEPRGSAVWIAWTRNRGGASSSRRWPLKPALRHQSHLLETRVYTLQQLLCVNSRGTKKCRSLCIQYYIEQFSILKIQMIAQQWWIHGVHRVTVNSASRVN